MDPVNPINYSQPGKVLTAEQKAFYDKNGYIVIQNCVPTHELQRYLRRFYEICEGKDVPFDMTVARDVSNPQLSKEPIEKQVSKIRDFNNDKVLFDYCKYPTIVDVVKDLIAHPNDSLMSMHSMLINKPPDNGKMASRHAMHQDLIYFPFRIPSNLQLGLGHLCLNAHRTYMSMNKIPLIFTHRHSIFRLLCFRPANYIVGAWTAMEKITKMNGCLEVVPGSHRLSNEPKEHGYPKWEKIVNPAYYGVIDFQPEQAQITYLEMDIGDTVFFHPLLLHGLSTNNHNSLMRSIQNQFCEFRIKTMTMNLMRKRFNKTGNHIKTYVDYFRNQAKPVNEKRANL